MPTQLDEAIKATDQVRHIFTLTSCLGLGTIPLDFAAETRRFPYGGSPLTGDVIASTSWSVPPNQIVTLNLPTNSSYYSLQTGFAYQPIGSSGGVRTQ